MEGIFEMGTVIGNRYKLDKLLGQGATSRVYLAFDLKLKRDVALKILKSENIDEKKIKNFKREARAISMLNHKNIIKIYAIEQMDDLHFIVQEYVEGITLKEYTKENNQLEISKIVNYIIQVLEGLEHAHAKKVIHKDIKSQNILLSTVDEIKITDFGIADILEDENTKTQSLMGTPQYVAPEVLRGYPATNQTDIYSVGILLYELLIGHAPFTAEKPTVIMMKQLNQPIPSVRQLRDIIPQSLENIVIKSTAKKLSNRYQTASEMSKDLKECLTLKKQNEDILILKNDLIENTMTTIDMGNTDKIKKMNNQKQRKILYGVLFSIIIVIILLVGIFFFEVRPVNVTIPDISGKAQNKAMHELEELGFDTANIVIDEVNSSKYDIGEVVSTKPPIGSEVKSNSEIKLNVSEGPKQVEVDNFIGDSFYEIDSKLENEGFKVQVSYITDSSDAGTIVNQYPNEGGKVDCGSTIKFVVSNGPQDITVPNFLGLSEKEVKKWGEENNITIEESTKCSNVYSKGKVLDQNKKYGAKVKENDSLKIQISSGTCKENSSVNKDTTSGGKNG